MRRAARDAGRSPRPRARGAGARRRAARRASRDRTSARRRARSDRDQSSAYTQDAGDVERPHEAALRLRLRRRGHRRRRRRRHHVHVHIDVDVDVDVHQRSCSEHLSARTRALVCGGGELAVGAHVHRVRVGPVQLVDRHMCLGALNHVHVERAAHERLGCDRTRFGHADAVRADGRRAEKQTRVRHFRQMYRAAVSQFRQMYRAAVSQFRQMHRAAVHIHTLLWRVDARTNA